MEELGERLVGEEDLTNKEEEKHAEQDAENIVKELLLFEKGHKDLPRGYLLKTFFSVLMDALKLLPFVIVGVLINTIGYFFLDMAGDTDQLAAIGINNFMVLIFFVALVFSSLDKFGMELSKAFGSKDYQRMKEIFGMGTLMFFGGFLFITVPIFLNAEAFMLKVGITPVIAEAVKGPARVNLAMFCMQICTEIMQITAISQGLERYFAMIGIFNLAISLPASYLFIYRLRLGIYGSVFVRFLIEIFKFCLAAFVFFKKTHPESRGFASLQDTMKNFRPYMIDSLKFTATGYSEHLGFAIIGYLVALTGDIDQIGAYYSLENYTGLPYVLGAAITIIVRTRVNILIGMDKGVVAGNFFRYISLCVYCLGILVGLITLYGRHFISDWYVSSDPAANSWCVVLTSIYALFIWADIVMILAMSAMKSLGKINLVIRYSSLTMLAGNIILGGLISKLNGTAVHLFILNMVMLALLSCLNMRTSFTSDWSKAPKHQGDLPRDSISLILERELNDQRLPNNDSQKSG